MPKKSTTGEPQDLRPASAYSDDADPIREITYDGETYTTRPARLVTNIPNQPLFFKHSCRFAVGYHRINACGQVRQVYSMVCLF